jgi:hypothetical protein
MSQKYLMQKFLKLQRASSILFFLLITGQFWGQSVVDDTTITNISYNQTTYFLKKDIKIGDTIRRPINEEPRMDFFQYTFVDSSLIQDLGAYGSAGYSYYQPYTKSLGWIDGIQVYQHLAYQDKEVKYYDSKVPHSSLTYRKNFGGAEFVQGKYTQSMGKTTNFGGQLRRFTAPISWGSNPNNDKYNTNFAILLHGSFISKNQLYKILVNYRFMNHQTKENGGIQFDSTTSDTDSLIGQDAILFKLTGAKSQEKRNEWSVYQEFSPFKKGQAKLFYEINRSKKVNQYLDNNLATNQSYYKDFNFSKVITKDSNVYRLIENVAGINGKFSQVSYAGYVKNRLWKYDSDTNRWDTATVKIKRLTDLYAGGQLFYQTKARNVYGNLNFEIGIDGTRKFDFISDFRFLKFTYLDLKNQNTLRQKSYKENHYSWSNNYDPYVVQVMKIEPYYATKKIGVSAFYSTQQYSNFVYFGADYRPIQDTVTRKTTSIGAELKLKLNARFQLMQFVNYTDIKNIPFLAAPNLYWHTNVNYKFGIKKLSALKAVLGLDFFYFSSYKPFVYRPELQNFAVQTSYTEKGYPVLDVYAVFKYKTVNVSLKARNLLQNILGDNGYYPVYGHFGQRRSIELGLTYNFFR